MNAIPPPPDEGTLAERRLSEHLAVLATDQPSSDAGLPARVVRTARWQRVLRVPLRVGGLLAAAVGDAVRVLLGRRRDGAAR